jgi:hypothetical protein
MLINDYEMFTQEGGDPATGSGPSTDEVYSRGDQIPKQPIWAHFVATEPLAGSTEVELIVQTATDFAVNVESLVRSGAMPIAEFNENGWHSPLPQGSKRLLRAFWELTGGAGTAGKIEAFITPSVEFQKPVGG